MGLEPCRVKRDKKIGQVLFFANAEKSHQPPHSEIDISGRHLKFPEMSDRMQSKKVSLLVAIYRRFLTNPWRDDFRILRVPDRFLEQPLKNFLVRSSGILLFGLPIPSPILDRFAKLLGQAGIHKVLEVGAVRGEASHVADAFNGENFDLIIAVGVASRGGLQ